VVVVQLVESVGIESSHRVSRLREAEWHIKSRFSPDIHKFQALRMQHRLESISYSSWSRIS